MDGLFKTSTTYAPYLMRKLVKVLFKSEIMPYSQVRKIMVIYEA